MSILAAALIFLASSTFPIGHALVSQHKVQEAHPLTRLSSGQATVGLADFESQSILVDSITINRFDWPEKDRLAYVACTAVHESAHLRYGTTREEIPLVWQYVCLHRLGASPELLDWHYWQIDNEVRSSGLSPKVPDRHRDE